MALDRTKMERQSGGVQKIFSYRTPDTIATVTTAGYFNAMTDEMDQHDIIMVVANTGGTPTFDNIFVTSVRGAASVTTSATEGVTAT